MPIFRSQGKNIYFAHVRGGRDAAVIQTSYAKLHADTIVRKARALMGSAAAGKE